MNGYIVLIRSARRTPSGSEYEWGGSESKVHPASFNVPVAFCCLIGIVGKDLVEGFIDAGLHHCLAAGGMDYLDASNDAIGQLKFLLNRSAF